MSGIEKLGNQAVAAVLARSARVTRDLSGEVASLRGERDSLQEKVANYEREDRIRTIAASMEDKGLNPEMTTSEKIASLRASADLDRVEEAIKMASAGRLDLATVTDKVASGGVDAQEQVHHFFLTGESGR